MLKAVRLLAWTVVLVLIAGQNMHGETSPTAVTEDQPTLRTLFFRCPNASPNYICTFLPFDRVKNTINGNQDAAQAPEYRDVVESIVSSKVLISGTVLKVYNSNLSVDDCEKYDWKIVAQAKESANVIVYGSSDVGAGMCGRPDPANPIGSVFLIALPVTLEWAEVTAFNGQADDPMRKGPSPAPSVTVKEFKNCEGDPVVPTIQPCDIGKWPVRWLYNSAWLFYNPLTQPGSMQVTINLSPVLGGGSQKLSYDMQINPGFHVGPGWLGVPVTFEKDSNIKANLDSLTAAVSYDLRFVKNPNFTDLGPVTVRKPQLQFRVGPEFAPTRPRDLNFVQGETVKVPFVLTFHRQPSAITFFPVIGLEAGKSLVSHFAGQDGILRGVAGADASFRWPFDITHNFLGDKPITVDYSYRMRWLANDAPFTDVANGGKELLSHQRRSYWRGSLNAPLSSTFQFKLTVQHGSLPPDFHALDYSLSLGFTFTTSGTTEH